MDKKEKKKVHRHKWEQNYSDCPECGSQEYYECECGEIGYWNHKTKRVDKR